MARRKVAKFSFLGPRVRFARTRRGLSEQELAKRMGLASTRQVIAVEKGKRGLSYDELVNLSKVLRKSYYFFTDPFQLVCDEKYRYFVKNNTSKKQLSKFNESMNEFLGIYRFLLSYFNKKDKLRTPKFDLQLPFTVSSSPELAVNAGERMADILELGTKPVEMLQIALEDKLGIMTLMLNSDSMAISGAALCLPEVSFICVNRRLSKSKRALTIAHELFHLLTWDALPYDRTSPAKTKAHKVEELADLFASSLLMPRQTVVQIEGIGKKQVATQWVVENATDLGVTARALQVRIKQIEAQTGKNLSEVIDHLNLAQLEDKIQDDKPAQPFSKKYAELISRAVAEPLMSTMDAVRSLAGETIDDAGDIFYAYGIEPPDTLQLGMPNSTARQNKHLWK